MRGELRVHVAAEHGRTRVIESYAHAPFHYLPPTTGDPPLLTIVNSSGGVLGGDVLDAEIDLAAGATLALRTQAATKLYRSERGVALSTTRFRLAQDAVLDYFPDELIPFAGSDYAQATQVDLASNAVMVMSEIVTAGRTECGERFQFTRLLLDVRCSVAGTLRMWDRADLQPSRQHLESRALLADATVWGTLYVMTTRVLPQRLADSLQATLASLEPGHGGASLAPLGLIGRVVSTSLDAVREALAAARVQLWQQLLPEGNDL